MSDTPAPLPRHLPAQPSLAQLRKLAKQQLAQLRLERPDTTLAAAQHTLARAYGFSTWSLLVQHVGARDASPATPRITTPVSRLLGAHDLAATTRFWCDVLGFTVAEHTAPTTTDAPTDSVTLVSGEACITLHHHDWAPDFSGGAQSPGTAMVLLPVSDVAAMHAAVMARGGQPSALTKVNWLKQELFEVRDPDGHAIWFAQSYQRDMLPRPARLLTQALPELPCPDVAAAVPHYRDVLGFSVNYEQADLGVMDRDDVRVLLIARDDTITGPGSAFFYVRDADTLYAELLQAGADVESEPVSQPWGMREFSVRDHVGNRLTFGQPFE